MNNSLNTWTEEPKNNIINYNNIIFNDMSEKEIKKMFDKTNFYWKIEIFITILNINRFNKSINNVELLYNFNDQIKNIISKKNISGFNEILNYYYKKWKEDFIFFIHIIIAIFDEKNKEYDEMLNNIYIFIQNSSGNTFFKYFSFLVKNWIKFHLWEKEGDYYYNFVNKNAYLNSKYKISNWLLKKISKDYSYEQNIWYKYWWYIKNTSEVSNETNYDIEGYIVYKLNYIVNNIQNLNNTKDFTEFLKYILKISSKNVVNNILKQYLTDNNWEIEKLIEWLMVFDTYIVDLIKEKLNIDDNNKPDFIRVEWLIEWENKHNSNWYCLKTKKIDNINYINIDDYLNIKNLNDFKQLFNIFHWTELLYIISYDLKVDLTELTLQSQVHLLKFLWSQNNEEFDSFKKSLFNIKDENDKIYFLTTFLACSEDEKIGNKVTELTNHEWSKEIFKAYSNLVDLQSEFSWDNLNGLTILKTILEKWKSLLLNYHTELSNKWTVEIYLDEFKSLIYWLLNIKNIWHFQIEKKYTQKIVKYVAFIKALTEKQKKWWSLSMMEFNNLSEWLFEISVFKWWNILKNTDSASMMDLDDDNYLTKKFSKEDYLTIIKIVNNTYKGDNNIINIVLKDIRKSLNDNESEFFILKNDEWKFIWMYRRVDKWDYYYFASLYVDWSQAENIWIWNILKETAQHWIIKEMKWQLVVNQKAFTTHIEKNWGIWNFIINKMVWNKTIAIMDFSLNKPSKIYKSKLYDFDKSNKIFKKISSQKIWEEISIEKWIIWIKILNEEIEFYLNMKLNKDNNTVLTRVKKWGEYCRLIIEQ